MTRAQKLSLTGAAVVLVLLGVVASLLLAADDGGSRATSVPSASTPSASQPPAEPVTVESVRFSTGPSRGGGWGTGFSLAFPDGEIVEPIATEGAAGEFTVTFGRPVDFPLTVLDRANDDGDPYLIELAWDGAAQVLTATLEAFPTVDRTVAGFTSTGTAGVEFVRTPAPVIENDCIRIQEPAPFTKLYGITTVRGEASLFEAGPMTIVARVPGQGQTTTMKMTSEGQRLVPFRAQVPLPLLDAPAEGYLAAFDHSAEDGSQICTVKVPVYMSPGE